MNLNKAERTRNERKLKNWLQQGIKNIGRLC